MHLKRIIISMFTSVLVFSGAITQVHAQSEVNAFNTTEGKTIKVQEIIIQKGEFKVEEKYSFEKNGYYTQTLKNGQKIIFANEGVIYEKGIRYTYYSSRVLYHYKTGEWTLGGDGIYRDDNGYIIVASNDHAQGTKVDTPFGKGIVRDCGCASGTIDIYTAF